jgi:hypothetical protein
VFINCDEGVIAFSQVFDLVHSVSHPQSRACIQNTPTFSRLPASRKLEATITAIIFTKS